MKNINPNIRIDRDLVFNPFNDEEKRIYERKTRQNDLILFAVCPNNSTKSEFPNSIPVSDNIDDIDDIDDELLSRANAAVGYIKQGNFVIAVVVGHVVSRKSGYITDRVCNIGVSKYKPNDEYNEDRGRLIAFSRALDAIYAAFGDHASAVYIENPFKQWEEEENDENK